MLANSGRPVTSVAHNFFGRTLEYWYAKDMYRRVIGALVAVFVVTQCFWFISAEPALAVGQPIFYLKDNVAPEVIRLDQNTLTVNARLYIVEGSFGDLANETFAFVTLKQTLTLQPAGDDKIHDYWKVSKAEFSNLVPEAKYGANNSKLITPQKVDFRNRTNETVALVDYSTPPKDFPPEDFLACYRVVKNTALTVTVKGTASGCSTATYNPTAQTPAGTIASYSTNVSANKITATNYDLKSDVGDSKYTKADIFSWFNKDENIPGLKITIYEERGQAPKVFVSKKALEDSGGRPPGDLTFKLVAHSGEGAVLVANKDWLTFEAYLGEELIKYLYLIVSDNLDANFVYGDKYDTFKKGQYDASADEITSVSSSEGDEFANSVGDYFTYTMNVPLNADGSVGGNSCGQGFIGPGKTVAATGPKEKDRNVIPTPDNNRTTDIGVDRNAARLLTHDCLNKSSNGWPIYWGVKDLFISTPGQSSDGCGITDIFGAGDIGKIFSQLSNCLFNSIFRPMVEWATDLVINAAGITYYRPEMGYEWRA